MKKSLILTIIISLTLVESFFVFLAYNSYNNKKVTLNDNNIKKNTIKKSSYAIMVQKQDKTGYEEYKVNNEISDTFPTEGYVFNSEKSKCLDLNGNEIPNAVSYPNNKVTVTSNKTAYCYIYFDVDSNDYLDKTRFKNYIDSIYGGSSTSIVFMNTTNVPEDNSGCGEIGDVSQKQNGSIIISVDTNNCGYDDVTFYIGQNGGVLAPADSSSLFSGSSLTSIRNLQYLNTSNVTDMSYMFSSMQIGDSSGLDLSSFNTSNVTSMSHMFADFSSTSLNLSGWNTSNVIDMSSMFYEADKLSSLDLSSFNTSHVTSMIYMFYGFPGSSIDLSSFNTSNVTDMNDMFSGSSNLTTIYASNNFVITGLDHNYIYSMFNGCTSLVGGNGTTYATNNDTYYYARIDAPGTPGYFTAR